MARLLNHDELERCTDKVQERFLNFMGKMSLGDPNTQLGVTDVVHYPVEFLYNLVSKQGIKLYGRNIDAALAAVLKANNAARPAVWQQIARRLHERLSASPTIQTVTIEVGPNHDAALRIHAHCCSSAKMFVFKPGRHNMYKITRPPGASKFMLEEPPMEEDPPLPQAQPVPAHAVNGGPAGVPPMEEPPLSQGGRQPQAQQGRPQPPAQPTAGASAAAGAPAPNGVAAAAPAPAAEPAQPPTNRTSGIKREVEPDGPAAGTSAAGAPAPNGAAAAPAPAPAAEPAQPSAPNDAAAAPAPAHAPAAAPAQPTAGETSGKKKRKRATDTPPADTSAAGAPGPNGGLQPQAQPAPAPAPALAPAPAHNRGPAGVQPQLDPTLPPALPQLALEHEDSQEDVEKAGRGLSIVLRSVGATNDVRRRVMESFRSMPPAERAWLMEDAYTVYLRPYYAGRNVEEMKNVLHEQFGVEV